MIISMVNSTTGGEGWPSRWPESLSGHDGRPSVALFGACGVDCGVQVEKAGPPGGQNLYLVMVAGPQWSCLELGVWTVESRWRRLAVQVARILIWSRWPALSGPIWNWWCGQWSPGGEDTPS